MEEYEVTTNGETRALLQAIRIINEIIQDPDELDKKLKEIQDSLKEDE